LYFYVCTTLEVYKLEAVYYSTIVANVHSFLFVLHDVQSIIYRPDLKGSQYNASVL